LDVKVSKQMARGATLEVAKTNDNITDIVIASSTWSELPDAECSFGPIVVGSDWDRQTTIPAHNQYVILIINGG